MSSEDIMVYTPSQGASLHTRLALPPEDPRHISREMLQALLEGRVQTSKAFPKGELPPHHYRVRTTGVLPAFTRLNGELYNGASDLFNGRDAWKSHEGSVGRDMTPGERVFFLKGFGVRTTMEMAILWGDEHGYWPATHTETNDFGCAHPELQRKNPIVCPGSFVVFINFRFVAVLRGFGGGRVLDIDNFVTVFDSDYLFLFVSKTLGHSEP